MILKLNKSFSSSGKVDDYDVRQMKRVLNRLGYYTPPADFGAHHIVDHAVFEALKAFQRDQNLMSDGAVKPGDKTEQELNAAVEAQDPNATYVWHTRKDDEVRASHAEREGQVFRWAEAPDGGHPGEDFGCRCWAEIVRNEKSCGQLDIELQNALIERDNALKKVEEADKRAKTLNQEIEIAEQALRKALLDAGLNLVVSTLSGGGLIAFAVKAIQTLKDATEIVLLLQELLAIRETLAQVIEDQKWFESILEEKDEEVIKIRRQMDEQGCSL